MHTQPTIRTDFPRPVREIEHFFITLADGTRLAARMWLPADAEQEPGPALLEFLPYRKSDGTAMRDAQRQLYYAGHGYAVLRVDLRGSGESDGVLEDEYTNQELDDAVELIAWIAEQPWCDGNVGMMGISWGGFNSLQVAARRPPALKAVVVIGFTDDRYADDVHYMGGCVLTSQMLSWSSIMFVYNGAPPDPALVGDEWRAMWLDRLEHSPPFIEAWLSHQTRDAYWEHGSVGEDYDAIQVPVYAIGGWADSYNNSVPRLLAGLSVPRKGLIGPWAHTFPEIGEPEPAIGFLQDTIRWWDHWLKGSDTGIMDEPMMRTWIQDSVPPATFYSERPGRWVADTQWPSPQVGDQIWYLNSDGSACVLGREAVPSVTLHHRGRLGQSMDVGPWGAYGYPGDFAGDQRAADGESLAFTSPPLDEAVDLLGYPVLELELSVDRPLALIAARLCDVAPDGASTLISWGLLNLTHRNGHKTPELLVPGQTYRFEVPLNVLGHRIQPGHRWRVSVTTDYMRHAWPSPEPVTLSLTTGASSRLRLPVRQPHALDDNLAPFLPAEISAPLEVEHLRPGVTRKQIIHELVDNEVRYVLDADGGRVRLVGNGMEVDDWGCETYTARPDDPLSLNVHIERQLIYQRGDWRVTIRTDSRMTADATHFHLSNVIDGYEGDTRVFTKASTKAIPRDHV